jgi:hypothetical protein
MSEQNISRLTPTFIVEKKFSVIVVSKQYQGFIENRPNPLIAGAQKGIETPWRHSNSSEGSIRSHHFLWFLAIPYLLTHRFHRILFCFQSA